MRPYLVHSLSTIFYALTSASGPTSIFINQIPEYNALSGCAETEVSTIVRNMDFGCGDEGRTTSFACFCYASSSKFTSMIGKHVSTACTDDPSQSLSALAVFSSYCRLGEVSGVTMDLSTPTGFIVSTSSTLGLLPSPAPILTTSRAEQTRTATEIPNPTATRREETVSASGTLTSTVARQGETDLTTGLSVSTTTRHAETDTANNSSSPGYSTSDKIALACGIGIALPATIAGIATVIIMLKIRRRQNP